jgi:RimJ/RimL family protein N-acetyltransferase
MTQRYYGDETYWFRPVEESDLEVLTEHRNDFETWTKLTSPLPVMAHRQARWLESLGHENMYFIGHYREDGMSLLRLTDIDWANRHAAVGLDVFKPYRGFGHAKPLFALLCRYAIRELGMHRLWLLVLEDNIAAQRVYRSVNFIEEGRFRQHIFRHGKFKDYVLMGVLEEEFDDSAIQSSYES